jgi:PEP-CTERM motif
LFKHTFSLTGLALLALVTAAPALAGPFIYNFTGACSDCYGGDGNATAVLTLTSDYTLGQTINTNNFVSFQYAGTDLLNPYTIAAGDANLFVSGSITSNPGYNTVSFSSSNGLFLSNTDGTWCTGGRCGSDVGTNGTFVSGAPEPSSVGLLGLGLAGIGFLGRRRLKTN